MIRIEAIVVPTIKMYINVSQTHSRDQTLIKYQIQALVISLGNIY